MQRLVSYRLITHRNFKPLSIRNRYSQENRMVCTLAACGTVNTRNNTGSHGYNFQIVRHQLTTARAGIPRLSKRKRKRTKNRKWTELLQVTDESMKETRTIVEKKKTESNESVRVFKR